MKVRIPEHQIPSIKKRLLDVFRYYFDEDTQSLEIIQQGKSDEMIKVIPALVNYVFSFTEDNDGN